LLFLCGKICFMLKKKLALLAVAVLLCHLLQAQYLMDMVDTTKTMGKGLLQLYNKYNRIKISGYTQFQFQATQTKGAKSFAGGDLTKIITSSCN
jgi:hypothetical protein